MGWLSRAHGAALVAREHQVTCGSRRKRSRRLAESRGQTVPEFSAKFVRRVGQRYSLIERPGGDCIFWDKSAGCTVYPARPVQCQTWPFWPENVEIEAKIGSMCEQSARGRATAASIRSTRSSHRFPGTKMNEHFGFKRRFRAGASATGESELRALYAELDREVAGIGPVCVLSGRCCRFLEYGHTLFVSTAEVGLPAGFGPCRLSGALDDGASCPWQDSRGHCTARDARPLGCRIYYCDPTYQEESHRLSERFIDRMKRLCCDHGIPWNYAPLHRQLHERATGGAIRSATRFEILLDTTLSHQYT